MKHKLCLAFIFSFVQIIGCSGPDTAKQGKSPYMGQETREIKALTSQEIEGYLSGQGMGLSKVAELNHYPGPRHVLDLADKLELSQQQKEQAQTIFDQMKKQAVAIGETYIAKERQLNALFETASPSSSQINSLLIEIGELKGRLRATHVTAHLKMKNILNPEQISTYDNLRGYSDGTALHEHHQDHS